MPGCWDRRLDTHRAHCWSFDDQEDNGDEGGYAVMGGAIKSPSNIERFQQARQQGMSRYNTAALVDKDYHGGVRGFDPLTFRIIKILVIRLSILTISYCATGTSFTSIERHWTDGRICTHNNRACRWNRLWKKPCPCFRNSTGSQWWIFSNFMTTFKRRVASIFYQ